ncbi:hypothetical protein ACOME3_007145 [Neoechinorhynchus agilis]
MEQPPAVPERPIRETFDEALGLYQKMNDLNDTSDTCQTVDQCLELLKRIDNHIERLNLYSANETSDDLSTESLKYMTVPAMIASVGQHRKSTIDQRASIADECVQYYVKDFLRRFSPCKPYNKKEIDDGRVEMKKFAQQRRVKIESFKKKKSIETRIHELEKRIFGAMQDDDEGLRDLYKNRLYWWISTADEDLSCLEYELKMLKEREGIAAEKPKMPVRHQKSGLNTLVLDKESIKKNVFGAGYPSVPKMSIDRFYENLKIQGLMPTDGANLHEAPKQETNNESDDHDEDEQKLKEARAFDDWKDYNWKGSGNRYNRS